MKNQDVPLVLIPGILCSNVIWAEQEKYFSNNTEVYIVDLLRMQTIDEIVADVCSRFKVFNLVGFSSGGYIAQKIYEANPKKINKMVFISALGSESARRGQDARMRLIRLCEKEGNVSGKLQFMRKLLSTYKLGTDDYEKISGLLGEVSPDIFVFQMRQIVNCINTLPTLGSVLCPVLAIFSTNDPFIPMAARDEMVSSIPGIEIKIFEDGGHMLPVVSSEEVNGAMSNFFTCAEECLEEAPYGGCNVR